MYHYKATFNWQGEVIKLSTTANNESQAYNSLIPVLSKILKRTPSSIRLYFNGDKDNYKITQHEVKNEDIK